MTNQVLEELYKKQELYEPKIQYASDPAIKNNNYSEEKSTFADDLYNYQKSVKDLYITNRLKNKQEMKDYLNNLENVEDKIKKANLWKKEANKYLNDAEKKEFNNYYADLNKIKSKDEAPFFIDKDNLDNLLLEPSSDGSKKPITILKLGNIIKSLDNSVVAKFIEDYYLNFLQKQGLLDEDLNKVKDIFENSGYFVQEGGKFQGIKEGIKEGITSLNPFSSDSVEKSAGILKSEDLGKFKNQHISPFQLFSNDNFKSFNKALNLFLEINSDDEDVKNYTKNNNDFTGLTMPNQQLINKVIKFNNDYLINSQKKDITEDLKNKKGNAFEPYLFFKNIGKILPEAAGGLAIAGATGAVGLPNYAALLSGLAGQAGLTAISQFNDNNKQLINDLTDNLIKDKVDLTSEEDVKNALKNYEQQIKNNKDENLKSSIKSAIISIPLNLLVPAINKFAIKKAVTASLSNKAVTATAGKILSSKPVAITASTINDNVIPTTLQLIPEVIKGNISSSDLLAYNLQNIIASSPILPAQFKAYREILENSKIIKNDARKTFKNYNTNDTNTDTNTNSTSTTADSTNTDTNTNNKKTNKLANANQEFNQIEAIILDKSLNQLKENKFTTAEEVANLKLEFDKTKNNLIDKKSVDNEINYIIDKFKIDKKEVKELLKNKKENIKNVDLNESDEISKILSDKLSENENIVEEIDNIPKIREDIVNEIASKFNLDKNLAKSEILKEYVKLANKDNFEATKATKATKAIELAKSLDGNKTLILDKDNNLKLLNKDNKVLKKFKIDKNETLNNILTDKYKKYFDKNELEKAGEKFDEIRKTSNNRDKNDKFNFEEQRIDELEKRRERKNTQIEKKLLNESLLSPSEFTESNKEFNRNSKKTKQSNTRTIEKSKSVQPRDSRIDKSFSKKQFIKRRASSTELAGKKRQSNRKSTKQENIKSEENSNLKKQETKESLKKIAKILKKNENDIKLKEIKNIAIKKTKTNNKDLINDVKKIKANIATFNNNKIIKKVKNLENIANKIEVVKKNKTNYVESTISEKVTKLSYNDPKFIKKLDKKVKTIINYVKSNKFHKNENEVYVIIDKKNSNMYILDNKSNIISDIPVLIDKTFADNLSNNKIGIFNLKNKKNNFATDIIKINQDYFERIKNFKSKVQNLDSNYVSRGFLDIPTKYYDEFIDKLDDANIYITSDKEVSNIDDLDFFMGNSEKNTDKNFKNSNQKLNKQQIKNIVDKTISTVDDIIVFDNVNELDKKAKANFEEFKNNNIDVWGYYDPLSNSIYIDNNKITGTKNLTAEQQLKMILKHELTHKHVRDYLNAQNLITITKKNKFIQKSLQKIAERWDLDLNSNEGKLRATEELIAELASLSEAKKFNYFKKEYGIEVPVEFKKNFLATIKKATNYLTDFYNDLANSNTITNSDLYNLIKNFNSSYGNKKVQKLINKINKIQLDTDTNAYSFNNSVLKFQKKVSDGNINNIETNTKLVNDNNILKTLKNKEFYKKFNEPKFYNKLLDKFVESTANYSYPLEKYLDKIKIGADIFNQAENKQNFEVSNIKKMFAEIAEKKLSKAVELINNNLNKNENEVNLQKVEQHLYEYSNAYSNIKNKRNEKLIKKHEKTISSLEISLKENLELLKNPNLKPDLKKLLQNEIRKIKKTLKNGKILIENAKKKNNTIRGKIEDIDQFIGGMTDAESENFLKNINNKNYSKELINIYDDILQQIYNKRENLLKEAVKNGSLQQSDYENLIQDKYWTTNSENIIDENTKAYKTEFEADTNSNLIYEFNSKDYNVNGRASPASNFTNNMISSLSRLATKISYKEFVDKLVEKSGFDKNKTFKENDIFLKKNSINSDILVISKDNLEYNKTKGFITFLTDKTGQKKEYKVLFNDDMLNKILFHKPKLIINKDTKTGKILSIIEMITRLYGKSIVMRPLKMLNILYRSNAEELTIINNNSNNNIFKNLGIAKAQVISEFVNKNNLYIKAIKAVYDINLGNKNKANELIYKYSFDDVNADIFNAVKHNLESGLTPKFSSSFKRNEDNIVDINSFKKSNFSDKLQNIFEIGELTNRSIITKILKEQGYSYKQAIKYQREAMNNLKTSYSIFSQYMKIANPFARSIATSNYYNLRSVIKAPASTAKNILLKSTKLAIASAIISNAINPLINSISSALTGRDEDYYIPEKYYEYGNPIYLPMGTTGHIIIIPYGFGLSEVIGITSNYLFGKRIRKYLNKNSKRNWNLEKESKDFTNFVTKSLNEINPIGNLEFFTDNNKTITQSLITSMSPIIFKPFVESAMNINKWGISTNYSSINSKINTDILTKKLTNIFNQLFEKDLNINEVENVISYIPILNIFQSSLKKINDGATASLLTALGASESQFSTLTQKKVVNQKFFEVIDQYKKEYDLINKSKDDLLKNKDKINKRAYFIFKNYKRQVSSLNSIKYKNKQKELELKDKKLMKFRENLIKNISNLKNKS